MQHTVSFNKLYILTNLLIHVPSTKDEVREENLNIMLAEILSERGLNALGEVILKKTSGARKQPDVMIILNGVRIIIEGKKPGQWLKLVNQCKERIDNGICDICFLVEYASVDTNLLSPTQSQIKEAVTNGLFNIAFLTFLDRSNLDKYSDIIPNLEKYENVTMDDLITYLMVTYTEVVRTDAISPTVNKIKDALLSFSSIASDLDINRLREVLELREGDNNDE